MQQLLKCPTAYWMRRGRCGTECERTLSFLRALNFFRHSTVSCLCIMDATVDRCWENEEQKEKKRQKKISSSRSLCSFHLSSILTRCNVSRWRDVQRMNGCLETLTQTHGCLRASWAVILLAGLMVSIWLIRFLASGVTVSHSGEGNWSDQQNHMS